MQATIENLIYYFLYLIESFELYFPVMCKVKVRELLSHSDNDPAHLCKLIGEKSYIHQLYKRGFQRYSKSDVKDKQLIFHFFQVFE